MKLLIIILFLFILGCQSDIQDGIIINKPYIAEHKACEIETNYDYYDNQYNYVIVIKTIPEQFQFIIEKTINNKIIRKTINVSEEIYKSYNTYDFYPRAEKLE